MIKFIEDNDQKTYIYSWLIQEGAFIEVSTKNNPDFTMACAVIALNADENHNIWGILQFKQYANRVPEACEFAYVFRKVSVKELLSDPKRADASAMLLVSKFKKYPPEYDETK